MEIITCTKNININIKISNDSLYNIYFFKNKIIDMYFKKGNNCYIYENKELRVIKQSPKLVFNSIKHLYLNTKYNLYNYMCFYTYFIYNKYFYKYRINNKYYSFQNYISIRNNIKIYNIKMHNSCALYKFIIMII